MNPFGLLLRGLLLLMGLVFLLSLLAVALLLLLVWLVRALWARLTGQPVQPWTFQILRRAQWDRFYGAAGPGTEPGRGHVQDADVIDVESRPVDAASLPHDRKDR
jgi:hypothetical protein